jgi:hypothetical protein
MEQIINEIVNYRLINDKEKAQELLDKIKILIRRLEQDTKIECYKDAIKIVSGGK